MLQSRADDLYHLGTVITSHAHNVNWQCAKADRFRLAMDARRAEIGRTAQALRELALAVRAKAAQMAVESAAGKPPTP